MGWSPLSDLLLGGPFQPALPVSAQRVLQLAHFQPSLIESVSQIAHYLLQTISAGSVHQVLLVTGFPTQWGFETDGPLGALNVASVLSLLGVPVKICLPSTLYNFFRESSSPFPVIGEGNFDFGDVATIETLHNTLLITVEYPGCNFKGVCHTMDGYPISSTLTLLNAIVAHSSPTAWVAIGDGGNEIGLGRFRPAVESTLPYGRLCQCSCQGGIATYVSANHSLLSVTSNYGALGLALELLHQTAQKGDYSWEKEEKGIEFLNATGIVDGVTGHLGTVDNIPQDLARQMLERLLAHYSGLD